MCLLLVAGAFSSVQHQSSKVIPYEPHQTSLPFVFLSSHSTNPMLHQAQEIKMACVGKDLFLDNRLGEHYLYMKR